MKRYVFLLVLLTVAAVRARKHSKPYKFESKTNGTKHSVNDIDATEESGQLALSSLANEFVHALHDGIYLINQAVQNADKNKEFQKSLVRISNDATDMAFAIQKEIHGDHRQLSFQLKSAEKYLSAIFPEITELAERNEENTTFSSSLLLEAIDSVLFAVQKLEVRADHSTKTNDELAAMTQKAFETLFKVLNETSSEDPITAEELQIQVHHLNHLLDKSVNKLEVWLHANTVENENAKIVEEIARNLGSLTADLRKSISTSLNAPQIVRIMESTCKSTAEQVRKLKQVENDKSQANYEHAKEIYRENLFESIATANTFAIKLRLIADSESLKN